jgi:hypothetical protein
LDARQTMPRVPSVWERIHRRQTQAPLPTLRPAVVLELLDLPRGEGVRRRDLQGAAAGLREVLRRFAQGPKPWAVESFYRHRVN